jgi:glycosyltransferase involved in cell wall biosynthesis
MTTPPGTTAVYVCYWSLRDPLCQSQSLAYLRRLAARGFRFVLITFEQPPYRLDRAEERRVIADELAAEGITWVPLPYHGPPYAIGKTLDFIAGVRTILRETRRSGARIVHARASIPASMGAVAARLAGVAFLYDADAPLSEEYVDHGYWDRGSLFPQLVAMLERFALRHASAIVTLTERYAGELRARRVPPPPMAVVPCCVDTTRFAGDAAVRDRIRLALGATRDTVLLVYAGKSGYRYRTDALMSFVARFRGLHPHTHLAVLSGDDPAAFAAEAAAAGLPDDTVSVRRVPPDEVPGWLAAADAGLAFINPAPCERAASPIKIGEYLAAGLPVVVSAGIGDYSDLIREHRLGTVVDVDNPDAAAGAASELLALLVADSGGRARRAAFAEERLSLANVGGARYAEIYTRLVGSLS